MQLRCRRALARCISHLVLGVCANTSVSLSPPSLRELCQCKTCLWCELHNKRLLSLHWRYSGSAPQLGWKGLRESIWWSHILCSHILSFQIWQWHQWFIVWKLLLYRIFWKLFIFRAGWWCFLGFARRLLVLMRCPLAFFSFCVSFWTMSSLYFSSVMTLVW